MPPISLGLGVGLHHARAAGATVTPAGPIWTPDFTGQSAGALTTLPSALLLTRASGATVSTSESAVVSGIGTDQARIGRMLATDALALLVEEARTNVAFPSRNVTWTGGSGTTTMSYALGVDGVSNATRSQTPSGSTGITGSVAVTSGVKYVASMWCRAPSGTTTTQLVAGWNGVSAVGATLSTTWQRLIFVRTTDNNTEVFVPSDGRDKSANGGIAAGARDAVIDFPQYERGNFVSSAIVTSTAAATRSGERLYHPDRSQLLSSGRLGMLYCLRPRGAWNEYTSNPRLVTFDASNYVELDKTTGQVRTAVGGVAFVTTGALSFAANARIWLWIEFGGVSLQSVAEYSTDGTTWTSLGSSGSPQGAISASGTVDLLCSGTSQQFSAFCERMEAWGSGTRPAGVL